MEKYYRNSVIEIDLDIIKNNLEILKKDFSQDKFLYAVIKGDAYGHGITMIADLIKKTKVDGIAVATLDEALIVRKYNDSIKILCLGIIRNQDIQEAINQDITIIVANMNTLEYLCNNYWNKPLKVHLKVNTGMNRIGFNKLEDIKLVIDKLDNKANIIIEGIFMHFATAEGYDKEAYFYQQLNSFEDIINKLDYQFKQIHCTNSSSLLKYSHNINFTNTNRVGIVLYGALEDKVIEKYNLKTAFTLKSKINQVEIYPINTKIGYNNNYTTTKDNEIIATIPLGYADGFARLHTGSLVKCNDQYGTIIGSICMDQMMIRFDQPVNIDDEVILISNDEQLNVFVRAKQAQTITHEIFTRFSNRVPKIYYENKQIVHIDNALLNK